MTFSIAGRLSATLDGKRRMPTPSNINADAATANMPQKRVAKSPGLGRLRFLVRPDVSFALPSLRSGAKVRARPFFGGATSKSSSTSVSSSSASSASDPADSVRGKSE